MDDRKRVHDGEEAGNTGWPSHVRNRIWRVLSPKTDGLARLGSSGLELAVGDGQ
jgi:hypothetical protein